ncbi:MAG: hypothetical protein HOD17_14725, partial [Desulfobacteraceae bacterium]|nr:hypothetical protein [Desulfobacteraceae bacterium]
TVVLVSHNPFIINELCDRVVWIKNGTVHLEGNVENVLKAYKEDIEKPNKVSAINI